MVRDAKGQFVKGHPPLAKSPGRKPRATEERLFEQFKRGIAVDDIDNIRAALVRKAGQGDVGAAKLIFEYLFGPPKQTVGLEGSPDNPVQVTFDLSRLPAEIVRRIADESEPDSAD